MVDEKNCPEQIEIGFGDKKDGFLQIARRPQVRILGKNDVLTMSSSSQLAMGLRLEFTSSIYGFLLFI